MHTDRAWFTVAITRSTEGQDSTKGQDQTEEGKRVSGPLM